MIKLPSNVKPIAAYFTRDSAFNQLADNATEDEQKEHARKWKVARETGDYHQLLIEGQRPTEFTLRALTADQFGTLVDMIRSGVGNNEVSLLAFRIALLSVANFGDAEVKFTQHPKFGKIATLEFLDKSGLPAGLALAIASELGGLVIDRASQLSPL